MVQVELCDWHLRLEKHFERLRNERSVISTDHPIYALEHGLSEEELKSLSQAIKRQILRDPPSKAHQLAWIVYATEIGYDYSGDEYWQTFERETPGWTVNGDRYWLKRCFLWFHQCYRGAIPTGRWAEHFSIICWPITHAILPKDLQRQLARILFELRHSFSAELFKSPTMLGERIAARSWNTTSRFQNFSESVQLLGQIATALLLQGQFGTAEIINSVTLRRISQDLDCERRAREWLRNARKEAEKRFNIRGISLGHGRSPIIETPIEKARAEVQILGIEPRLILRPNDPRQSSWDVLLEIPDFSHLLFHFPDLRDILTGSRCTIEGSSSGPRARGSLLYGPQRVALSKWPSSADILLKFDKTNEYLEALLRTECLLRPGPKWLFRIATDNLAYEKRGLSARPGERYVMLHSDNPPHNDGIAKPIKLACDGIYGVLIDLPAALTEEWQTWLLDQGLCTAKTIEVWPAGLGAVAWDGEGYGEWLASERPCLGICSDHPISSLVVSMDSMSDQYLVIDSVIPGEPVFIELPELFVGLHKVRFSIQETASDEEEVLGDLDVIMRIRETRPWSPGLSPQGPLDVQINPASPTLEQLWEGKVDISIGGPSERTIKCKVSLFETNTETAILTWELTSLALPMSPTNWRNTFDRYIKNVKGSAIAYDAARSCELDFSAEELGAFSIHCERDFKPLRWALQRDRQDYVARLFDDSGKPTLPKISSHTFEHPAVEEILEHKPCYRVAASGGLYIARHEDTFASIIIPPSGTITTFSGLSCKPQIDMTHQSLESLIKLIDLSERWSKAHLSGEAISAIRRRDVLFEITRQICRILAGQRWYDIELAFNDRRYTIPELARFGSSGHNDLGLINFLQNQCNQLAECPPEERVRQFTRQAIMCLHLTTIPPQETVVNRGVIRRRPVQSADNATWLCDLALRLVSDPATVREWAGIGYRDGIARLQGVPMLARAARFLVIAIDRHSGSNVQPGQLYANWEWS